MQTKKKTQKYISIYKTQFPFINQTISKNSFCFLNLTTKYYRLLNYEKIFTCNKKEKKISIFLKLPSLKSNGCFGKCVLKAKSFLFAKNFFKKNKNTVSDKVIMIFFIWRCHSTFMQNKMKMKTLRHDHLIQQKKFTILQKSSASASPS